MSRYFLECAYDGSAYNGWQTQPNGIAVQQKIDEALSTVLRFPVETLGSGRTDTGVHALQQFAHFDAEALPLSCSELMHKLNSLLPYDISIAGIHPVKPDAHARFDAVLRSYRYQVIGRKDAFAVNRAYYIRQELDVAAMNAAASLLLEYEDFSSFCKSHASSATMICHIREAAWAESGGMLVFSISADRFLRNMVRAVVGTLLDVGTGKLSLNGFRGVIEGKDRRLAGSSVPAHGLFLARVEYPSSVFIG